MRRLVKEDDRLCGIFAEKDYARESIKRVINMSAKVETIMSKKIYYAEPNFTLEDCLQIYTHSKNQEAL